MKIELRRLWSDHKATIGMLLINNTFACFTLEDEPRKVKVKGETRIPEGTYEIKLRTEGRIHEDYAKKFDFHVGTLWLQNVPGFQYILIHIGNTEKDTEGCILVGDCLYSNLTLGQSTQAYTRIYKTIANELQQGNLVTITIKDLQ